MLADRVVIAAYDVPADVSLPAGTLQVLCLCAHSHPDDHCFPIGIPTPLSSTGYSPISTTCSRRWSSGCFGGQPAVWFCDKVSADVGERAVQYGILLLLSDDSACGGVVFPLSFRPFREDVVCHSSPLSSSITLFISSSPLPGRSSTSLPLEATMWRKVSSRPSVTISITIRNLLPGPGYQHGFFYSLVEGSQQVGERPTAAFPSSHVGMSTVLMIMAWRGSKQSVCLLVSFLSAACAGLRSIFRHIT